MALLVAYPKQYAIGPMPIRPRADWSVVQMAERLFLSHCPKLRVTPLQSRHGQNYWLIGLAVPADHPLTSLADAFRLKDPAEIENWTAFWAGRWLLVSAHRCWQDASGSLALCHRRVDGAVWLSSSTRLLSEHVPNAPSSAPIPWQLAHQKGIEAPPLPYTMRDGIYKLLPQRTIDPRDGSIRPLEFAPPACGVGETPLMLASALKTLLGNWARCDFRERWVGLTAGLDTRTILAAASAAEIEVRTYTTNYSFIDARDRIWPPRLAARVGLPHRLRQPLPLDPTEVAARMTAISEHTDGASSHPSFGHMAHHDDGMLDDPGRSTASGNSFEIGRCFYWRKFAQAGLGDAPPDADQLLAAFTSRSSWRPEPISAWRQALHSWIGSLPDLLPVACDWRDRFYLDQRLGSWNCAVQRGGDLLESTAFTPGNCLWIFHLLLQAGPEQRQHGLTQREAIRLLAPRLLEIPINPEPLGARLTRVAKERARALFGPRAVRALKSLRG